MGELLAGALGRVLQVQPERLRVGLWSGAPSKPPPPPPPSPCPVFLCPPTPFRTPAPFCHSREFLGTKQPAAALTGGPPRAPSRCLKK